MLRYFHQPPKATTNTVVVNNTAIQTVSDVLNNKVDKSAGRGLSQNNYSTPEKNKLRGVEEGAEVNVQVDWDEEDPESDMYIKNKPDLTVVIDEQQYTLPEILIALYNDVQLLKQLWTDDGSTLTAKAGRSVTGAGFYDSTIS